MDTLARLMRDSVELAPESLEAHPSDHVEEVWQRGRRRQALRATLTATGALAVLAVVASLVLGSPRVVPDQLLPADGARQTTGVTAYPQRIGHQWWVRGVQDRPGPMAAVVLHSDDDRPSWELVSPSGRRHGLPLSQGASADIYPVLSSDGRRLAYYQPEFDRMLVHDLTTGAIWFVDAGEPQRSGPDRPPRARSIQMNQQSPGWFSPSGSQLALSTAKGPYVIEMHTDKRDLVPNMHQAAGWLDEDRLVGRALTQEGSGSVVERGIDVVVWDRRTGETSSLGRVDLTGAPAPVQTLGQWWGSVRGDGTLWLSVSDDGSQSWLGGVSLDDLSPVTFDGAPASELVWNEVDSTSFGVSWAGSRPIALVLGDAGYHVHPTSVEDLRKPRVVIEQSVGVHQVIWADDALNGSPSFSLFGTSTAWWTWWWREIALVAVGAAALAWWHGRRRESRRVARGPRQGQ